MRGIIMDITTVCSEEALLLFAQDMENNMEQDQDFFTSNLQKRIAYFNKWVEDLHAGGLTYIEAIVNFCDKHDVEYESTTKLISESLKVKIYEEATSLNQIKKIDKYVTSFL